MGWKRKTYVICRFNIMYIKILVIYFTEMESSAKIPIETQEFMKSQKMLQKKNESKKSSQFQALLKNAIIKTLLQA